MGLGTQTVEVRGGDQDAELAVPQPGDEPARFPYPDAVAGRVAVRFERELDGHGVGLRAKHTTRRTTPERSESWADVARGQFFQDAQKWWDDLSTDVDRDLMGFFRHALWRSGIRGK
jgi:hypothetical protein